MNWPFRSPNRPRQTEHCEQMEPLLSLYADGMTSADELRRVAAHLPVCADCREALSWMQATHRALASRPIVAPPADLHARIAQAIAASAAAPLSPALLSPALLHPARAFRLRPAYAAAASLSVLGLLLSYSLLHTPKAPLHNPAHLLSSVPPSPKPAPRIAAQVHRRSSAGVSTRHPLTASNPASAEIKPAAVRRLPAVQKTRLIPQSRVAVIAPPVVPATGSAAPVLKTITRTPPQRLTASAKIGPGAAKSQAVREVPLSPKIAELPRVATHSQAPGPVPVTILPPTVTMQTASAALPRTDAQSSDILGPVRAQIGKMQTAAYLTTRQSYRGAAVAMHSLDTEHAVYVDAIHSP